MSIKENGIQDINVAMEKYETIRKALTGLYEIFDINFFERSIHRKAGMDNLKAINDNVLKILKSSYSPREVRMKLRAIEFDEQEIMETFPL